MASFVHATSLFALAASTPCTVSSAHEAMNQSCGPSAGQAHDHSSSVPPGNVGDMARVKRTAIIEMSDDMRFRPLLSASSLAMP
jgi:hypothetical protein